MKLVLSGLRVVALLVLSLASSLLLSLALAAWMPMVAAVFATLLSGGTGESPIGGRFMLLEAVLIPALLFAIAQRRGWASWKLIGCTAVGLAPIFVYLAWDDAELKRPVTLEESTLPGPAAAESYAISLRYSRHGTQPEASTVLRQSLLPPTGANLEHPDKWREWVGGHRAEIRQAWTDVAAGREWFADLDRFEVIGDLRPARADGSIIYFQPFRTTIQTTTYYASLLAVEGRGDEAVAALLPALRVSRKLEPAARTAVRLMMARVGLQQTMDTLRFVLATTAVSPAVRETAAAALAAGGSGPALARRLVLLMSPVFESGVTGRGLGDVPRELGLYGPGWLGRKLLNAVGWAIFNPRATIKLHTGRMEELATLAETRQIRKMDTREREDVNARQTTHFKNPGGHLLLSLTALSRAKRVESYWRSEDERVALITELRGAK